MLARPFFVSSLRRSHSLTAKWETKLCVALKADMQMGICKVRPGAVNNVSLSRQRESEKERKAFVCMFPQRTKSDAFTSTNPNEYVRLSPFIYCVDFNNYQAT